MAQHLTIPACLIQGNFIFEHLPDCDVCRNCLGCFTIGIQKRHSLFSHAQIFRFINFLMYTHTHTHT